MPPNDTFADSYLASAWAWLSSCIIALLIGFVSGTLWISFAGAAPFLKSNLKATIEATEAARYAGVYFGFLSLLALSIVSGVVIRRGRLWMWFGFWVAATYLAMDVWGLLATSYFPAMYIGWLFVSALGLVIGSWLAMYRRR